MSRFGTHGGLGDNLTFFYKHYVLNNQPLKMDDSDLPSDHRSTIARQQYRGLCFSKILGFGTREKAQAAQKREA